MACPQQKNIGAKRKVDEIQTTCVQNERATSRLRDMRGSCRSRSIGRWYKSIDLKKSFDNSELLEEVVAVMQKTVLMDSESIVQRVMSGLIQGKDNE